MDDSCTLAQEYLVNMVGVRDMYESELAQTKYVCIYISENCYHSIWSWPLAPTRYLLWRRDDQGTCSGLGTSKVLGFV